MPVFKCPACNEIHTVQEYDNKDYVCENSSNRISQKVFNDVVPTDLMTTSGFMVNTHSTKVDEAREVTVEISGPEYRNDGTPHDQKRKTNY